MTPQDARDQVRWDAVEEAVELLLDDATAEALPMLRAALERDPGNAYAHYYLGFAAYQQGAFEQACAAFAEAERRAPGYLGAVVSLGHALRMLDRLDEAARAGDRALRLRTEDPEALFLMAQVASEQGEVVRAIDYLQRFLKTGPQLEARHDAEAMLSVLQGQVAGSPRPAS